MEYYEQLVGYTVTKAEEIEDDFEGEVWPRLTLEKDGKVLIAEVSRDPEGNGPGFLFIGPPGGEDD